MLSEQLLFMLLDDRHEWSNEDPTYDFEIHYDLFPG